MTSLRKPGLLVIPIAVTALALSGCGDDEEVATVPSATAPTVAPAPAPAPTATQPAAAAPAKPQKTAPPEPAPAEPTSEPNACQTEKTISQLKFQGVACDEAAVLAGAWEKEQDRCSTIDDPGRPEGYNRTCTLEDYTCRTKRDVKSDARFVACAKGGSQVRFTWAP
jgi:hypothetical protein